MKTTTSLIAAVLATLAAPALANTTMVSCPGYVISLADEVAIQGEALAGTRTAFESMVCERSSEDAAGVSGDPAVIPVFIEDLGVATRIVVFPTGGDD